MKPSDPIVKSSLLTEPSSVALIQADRVRHETLKAKLAKELKRLALTEEQADQLVRELDGYAKLVIDTYQSHPNRTRTEQTVHSKEES